MQSEPILQSFTISKKTSLKCGDIIKILDIQGNTVEYAYVDVRTQSNETVSMAVTNAIQKV
jgi:phosphopantetheine adenylyltransferase